MDIIQMIIEHITKADEKSLNLIVQAVLERYRVLFPEEEVLFLSLPLHDPRERAAALSRVLDLLNR